MKMKDFLDFLKLPPNILFAISLVSGTILFAPISIVNALHMLKFRNQFGFAIAFIFLISVSLLVVLALVTMLKHLKKMILIGKLKRKSIKYLLNAENYKVDFIKEFIKDKTHTLQVQANDGLTIELTDLDIIASAGQFQPVDFGYNNEMYLRYYLQPWVINLISNNKKLKEKYKIKSK